MKNSFSLSEWANKNPSQSDVLASWLQYISAIFGHSNHKYRHSLSENAPQSMAGMSCARNENTTAGKNRTLYVNTAMCYLLWYGAMTMKPPNRMH